jgi:hypothetical protein
MFNRHSVQRCLLCVVVVALSSTMRGIVEGSTVKKNFVGCCELVQEIGGLLDYQQDPRWKEQRCLTVMSDLAPCFSACKEIHHGKVRRKKRACAFWFMRLLALYVVSGKEEWSMPLTHSSSVLHDPNRPSLLRTTVFLSSPLIYF